MESEFKGGCCFCFTIKKSNVGRSKSSGIQSSEQREYWGGNEEMLSDMSTFCVEEQERRLKKAKEDEERVSREAERIILWVKQESARIDDSVVKTVLGDQENEKAASK